MNNSLRSTIATVCSLTLAATVSAQSSPTLKFGGFGDGYFAYDFGKPPAIDRSFTTQAARHSEFNINLAQVEMTATADRVRGRFVLQTGTSVQANYAAEPTVGAYSGPDLAQHIQEAVMGARLSDNLWVDGGIFLSHIGSESWISRDNLTYTRSLIAEYSPYYQSGVKFTWQASPSLSVLATVVNGWQIISENNQDKSLGLRFEWTVSPKLSLGYYNLFGNEQPEAAESQSRMFNGVTAKLLPSDRVTLLATLDVGRQDGAGGADATTWWGGALIGRVQHSQRVAFSLRAEAYEDEDQTIIVTGGDPFRGSGFSVGVDVTPQAGFVWRSELKSLRGRDAVFLDEGALSRSNTLLVTSLGITF